MKKLFLITITGLIFSSCKKDFSDHDLFAPDKGKANKKETSNTKETVQYSDSVWSCSASEWIWLQGEVTTHIIEQRSDDKYHILYESNFNHVTGTGTETGNTYKGGGILKGQVTLSLDEDNLTVSASTKEKLHFLCNGIGYDFYVVSQYKRNSQGDIKADYVTDKTQDCGTTL